MEEEAQGSGSGSPWQMNLPVTKEGVRTTGRVVSG